MSSKAVSHASELAGSESGWLARVWDSVKQFSAAISRGREAEYTYRELVSRGVPSERAVRIVMEQVINRS